MAAGVTCEMVDFATSDFTEIPDDFDYVLNFAIARGGDADWDRDLAANGESVGLLMSRCRNASAFCTAHQPRCTNPRVRTRLLRPIRSATTTA